MTSLTMLEPRQKAAETSRINPTTSSGSAQDFLHFVELAVSPRAHGMSISVNLNPDKVCNFDCVYCEVNRTTPPENTTLDVAVMVHELEQTLDHFRSGKIREDPIYRRLPEDLYTLRQVSLSGDGEPTLCPQFLHAIEAIVHLRSRLPFFKLVLLTNASGLDRAQVIEGLGLFTRRDEIWAKLDGGTQDYLDRINHTDICIETILENILTLARRRPVIIQSLFPALNNESPSPSEIDAYVQRLKTLKESGAQIPLVQIYSATRPAASSPCGHLPLPVLSTIARRVKEATGLRAEVS